MSTVKLWYLGTFQFVEDIDTHKRVEIDTIDKTIKHLHIPRTFYRGSATPVIFDKSEYEERFSKKPFKENDWMEFWAHDASWAIKRSKTDAWKVVIDKNCGVEFNTLLTQYQLKIMPDGRVVTTDAPTSIQVAIEKKRVTRRRKKTVTQPSQVLA